MYLREEEEEEGREGKVGKFDFKAHLKSKYYIGYAVANLGEDASEDQIIEFAIKTYQQNLRLKVTGILDDETLSNLTAPQCGNYSRYNSPLNNYDSYAATAFASQFLSTKIPKNNNYHDSFSAFARNIANTFNLATAITDEAFKIYKMLEDYKFESMYKNTVDFMYASIYIACHQQGIPLSMQEMYRGSGDTKEGCEEYDIVLAKEYIVEQLKVKMDEEMNTMVPTTTVHAWWTPNANYCSLYNTNHPKYKASSLYHLHLAVSLTPTPTPACACACECDAHLLLQDLCDNLGMTDDQLQVVQETVENAGDLNNIRGKPLSVAAAIIFMITQLSNLNTSLRDISIATIVAEDSIKSAYRDVCPHAANIIPKWYAKEEDLKNLSSPVQDQD